MWRGVPAKRARGNLERFGYGGTSDKVSIKYGRYGLLCFFLSSMYTRIHMNMMHDPNTPHFLICLQVSRAFGHQGLIRVTFASQRKKERKFEWTFLWVWSLGVVCNGWVVKVRPQVLFPNSLLWCDEPLLSSFLISTHPPPPLPPPNSPIEAFLNQWTNSTLNIRWWLVSP